jgi:hypothetical protein
MHEQGLSGSHLRALAALPQLTMLNLIRVHLAEDAVELGGLGWLAAHLPRLRVLDACTHELVQSWSLSACCVQLKGLLRMAAW